MARIKNPLLSLKAIGKLGNITFRRSRKIDVAEKIPVIPDAKSPGQLAWRPMFLKCVDLWHTLSAAEKQIWESQARVRHMTGYAWYLSQCLRPNPGIYLPLVGGTMQGAIDMAKNRLLKLPLPTDAQEPATKAYADLFTLLTTFNAHEVQTTGIHGVGDSIIDSIFARNAAIAVHGAGHITILPFAYDSIGQGTWVIYSDLSQALQLSFYNSTNANGDNATCKAYLSKGTYTMMIMYEKASDGGLVDIYIDAVEIVSIDMYAAVAAYNQISTTTSIIIASPGIKSLTFQLDGKNGSSSGYKCRITSICLWRTA